MKKQFFVWIFAFTLAFFIGISISNASTSIDGGDYSNVMGIRFNNTDYVAHVGDNGLGGWVRFNATNLYLPSQNCNETRIVNNFGVVVPYQMFGQNMLNTSCNYGMLVPTLKNENVTWNLYYNASGADVTPSYPTYHYFEDTFDDGNAGGWGAPYACTSSTFPTNKPFAIGAYGWNMYDSTNTCAGYFDKDIGENFRWTVEVFPGTLACGNDHTSIGIKDASTGQNPSPIINTQANETCMFDGFVAGNHTELSLTNYTLIELGCPNTGGCTMRLNYTHEFNMAFSQQDGLYIGGNGNPNNNTWDNVNLWNYSVYLYPKMDSFEVADAINITPSFFQCTGTAGEQLVFNFTFWKERTDDPIINHSYLDMTLVSYQQGSIQQNLTSSLGVNSTSEVDICASFIDEVTINTHIEYGRPEYDTRFYYHSNFSFGAVDVPQLISLYLLEIVFGDLATFTVTDESDNPLGDNVIVKIQKYFPASGTYKNVAMIRPDDEGIDSTYLRFYDTWYRFIVEQNGVVLFISNARKITQEANTIKVPTGNIGDILDNFENINFILSFSNVTRNYTATFTQTQGATINGCLKVTRLKASGETFICEKCELSTSATLICGVWAENTTYVSSFYVKINGIAHNLATLVVNLGDRLSDSFGLDGVFMALMVFLLLVSVGSFNPQIAVGLGVVGVVFSTMMGFVYISISVVLGIVVLGAFLIFKTRNN